jgi:predicted Zn-dependent protease
MLDQLERRFRDIAPAAQHVSLRYVRTRDESVYVRQDVLQPVSTCDDAGVMITVVDGGGMGAAATSDLSESGLRDAATRAHDWARRTAGRSVVDFGTIPQPTGDSSYRTPEQQPWASVPLADKVALLREECARLKTSERIVDWSSSLWSTQTETLILQAGGGRVHQQLAVVVPMLQATANDGPETITRTFGGHAGGRQGGLEVLEAVGFRGAAPGVAAEALELLDAPDCPSGAMDLLLDPDQMVLQIHESIGHPLELDRILGDERNYAGTSFVTRDMFGSYRYGSDLLNVTFDPTVPDEIASYGFDDDGQPATKAFLIRKGILERPLGGTTSQVRAGMPGVSNARATSWNRQPIDRMANINLEPGDASFDDMVASVERGVWMRTNCSWSIDDSRNKFQFGCEWARLIEGGKLGRVVRKPNYRGISATFWRSLAKVGDASTRRVMGTPNCGKGEPNQVVKVGHASPPCLFTNVEVFGGA